MKAGAPQWSSLYASNTEVKHIRGFMRPLSVCLGRISGFYYLPPDGGLDKYVTILENHVPCSGKFAHNSKPVSVV